MEDSTQWRQTNSIGLKYRTLKAGEGSVDYENADITEEYIILASDLLAWVNFGFPEPTVFGGTLLYPQQPVIKGLGTLVPNRITFKSFDPSRPADPFGSDPTAPVDTYTPYMVLTVDYGPTPENDQPQEPNNPFTFLQVSANASGVFLNSPMEKGALWEVPPGIPPWSVDSDGVFTGESTEVQEKSIPHTVTEPQVEWSVMWPSIPFTFWDGTLMGRMRDKLGKVNESSMPLLHNAPAATILFMSYSASTQYTWRQGKTGQGPIRLEMKFVEKNFEAIVGKTDAVPPVDIEETITHQHLYRPNKGYRKLKINGNYLYKQADLNEIWSP